MSLIMTLLASRRQPRLDHLDKIKSTNQCSYRSISRGSIPSRRMFVWGKGDSMTRNAPDQNTNNTDNVDHSSQHSVKKRENHNKRKRWFPMANSLIPYYAFSSSSSPSSTNYITEDGQWRIHSSTTRSTVDLTSDSLDDRNYIEIDQQQQEERTGEQEGKTIVDNTADQRLKPNESQEAEECFYPCNEVCTSVGLLESSTIADELTLEDCSLPNERQLDGPQKYCKNENGIIYCKKFQGSHTDSQEQSSTEEKCPPSRVQSKISTITPWYAIGSVIVTANFLISSLLFEKERGTSKQKRTNGKIFSTAPKQVTKVILSGDSVAATSNSKLSTSSKQSSVSSDALSSSLSSSSVSSWSMMSSTPSRASYSLWSFSSSILSSIIINPLQESFNLLQKIPQYCVDFVSISDDNERNISTDAAKFQRRPYSKKCRSNHVVGDHVAGRVRFDLSATKLVDNPEIFTEEECQRVWYSPSEIRQMVSLYKSPLVFFLEELVGEDSDGDKEYEFSKHRDARNGTKKPLNAICHVQNNKNNEVKRNNIRRTNGHFLLQKIVLGVD